MSNIYKAIISFIYEVLLLELNCNVTAPLCSQIYTAGKQKTVLHNWDIFGLIAELQSHILHPDIQPSISVLFTTINLTSEGTHQSLI